MAGLEDMLRSSAPGGNIGKPLMLALLALLGSALYLGAAQDLPRARRRNRRLMTEPVGSSADWADCWTSSRRAGWEMQPIPGLVPVKTNLSRPASSVPHLAVVSSKLSQRSGLSDEEITKQLSQVLPGIVDKLTPQGRLPTVSCASMTFRRATELKIDVDIGRAQFANRYAGPHLGIGLSTPTVTRRHSSIST
jgi:YidB-like protein